MKTSKLIAAAMIRLSLVAGAAWAGQDGAKPRTCSRCALDDWPDCAAGADRGQHSSAIAGSGGQAAAKPPASVCKNASPQALARLRTRRM